MPWSGPNSAQREVASGFVAVPTSLTTVTATKTRLFQIVLTNNSGASITFSLQDMQGTPVRLFDGTNGFSVDPGVPFVLSIANGTVLLGGMRWVAGGAGLYADVIATYEG